ncbi:MAG: T9SS type A sorting domain-containing protein [Bacteroidia bacterium]|nr:T9SS type A sorting domain-containing protein [Bacteroidia bacterium]
MGLRARWLFMLVALVLVLAAAILIEDKEAFSEHIDHAEPDWSEQYLAMKGNEPGINSRNNFDQVRARQAGLNRSGVLLNVKEVGPYNRAGRTRAFLIDKANHNHFIAGGVSGGIWESLNKGQSWRPIDDQAPCMAVSCITQDLDASLIYYGTGENSGNSAGIPGDGVYRSTDGGKSFTRLTSTLSPAFDYVISIKSSIKAKNVLYVGTADSGLYRSINAGLSFTKVFSTSTRNIEDIETFKDGSVRICVNSTGIFSSPNGDPGTFTKLTGGLPATGFRNIAFAYCDSFPNVQYASFENSAGNDLLGVWKTTDGGTTWTKTSTPRPGYYYFPYYALVLDVKPDDPDFVLSGCVWMDYSTNGGTAWKSVVFSGADDHTIVFDPVDPAVFYIGHDAGISKYNTSTVATAYSMLNKGFTVTQFYAGAHFASGTSFFGGTQDNSTLASRNSDSIFQLIDSYNGDGTATQISQQNQNIAYISWQYGRIRKTMDAQSLYPAHVGCMKEMDADNNGGLDDGGWFNNPFEINKLDGNQLYSVTLKRVWRTTNGATNWVPLTNVLNGDGNSPYSIGISNALNPTVYIGGPQLKFYRVDNAATAVAGSEVNLRSSAPSNILSSFISNITVHPTNDSIVYVALSTNSVNPRLWKVTKARSGNPVWKNISGNLPVGFGVNWVEVDPLNPDLFFIAATDYGIYTTSNGGVIWTYESAIPNVPVPQIRLRQSDRKLFIFTHGRGAWIADLPSLSTGFAEQLIAKRTVGIYPNPAREVLNIIKPGKFIAKVFNAAGQLMLEKQVEDQLNIAALPPGVYFLKAEQDAVIYNDRFVKSEY